MCLLIASVFKFTPAWHRVLCTKCVVYEPRLFVGKKPCVHHRLVGTNSRQTLSQVLGFDVSPNMVKEAGERAKQDGVKNAEFAVSPAEELPVEDGKARYT